ncbi:MAG: DNA repair protein RadC [Chromatiales bacterium]|nr:DNA repair protein RadC [Chromatiales bacterium]
MRQKRLPLPYPEGNRFAGVRVCEMDEAERSAVVALALEVLAERHRPGQLLASPPDTRAFLQLHLGGRKAEVFGLVYLDNRHRVIAVEELFNGTIDGASVYPRVVVQRALERNAAAAIAFHNHPSGEPEPSAADRALTRKLSEALALVDVRLLDHVVTGTQGVVSFAERGWL